MFSSLIFFSQNQTDGTRVWNIRSLDLRQNGRKRLTSSFSCSGLDQSESYHQNICTIILFLKHICATEIVKQVHFIRTHYPICKNAQEKESCETPTPQKSIHFPLTKNEHGETYAKWSVYISGEESIELVVGPL